MLRRRLLRRGAWTLVAAALAVGVYAVGVRWAVSYAVDGALARFAAAVPGRAAQVRQIRVHPFTLGLDLGGARLESPDRVTLDIETISARLSPRSLVAGRLVWGNVVVTRPRAVLTLAAAGQTERPPLLAALADWRIERLELRDGALEILDGTGPGALGMPLEDISVLVTGFDTAAQPAGRATVLARGPSGAELALDASLTAGFARAEGRFALTELDIGRLARLDTRLAALEPRGRLRIAGDYTLHAPDGHAVLELANGRAELGDFAVEIGSGIHARASRAEADVSAVLEQDGGLGVSGATIVFSGQAFELLAMGAASPLALSDAGGVLAVGVAQTRLDLEARVEGTADLTLAVTPAELDLRLDGIPAERLSAYAQTALGRGLAAGRIDLKLVYQLAGRPSGRLWIGADDLALMPSPAADLSLELAAALLETAEGGLELAVPLTAGAFGEAVGVALRRRIAALTGAPFDVLGRLVARSGARLRDVAFDPGVAALSARALGGLDPLGDALRARPGLVLRVPGRYHPAIDRDALAAQQIELHVLLATAGPTFRARPEPIDFTSPRAHDVLDEFAGERLPAAQLQALAARFAGSLGDAATPAARSGYYRALFEALVANETIEAQALQRLARFRAQSVADALVARGIASERIVLGGIAPLPADAASVWLPLELEP